MILDTNAYTALARGAPSITNLVRNVRELALPLPVIAELRYGFVKGSQPDRNEQILQQFLAQSQVSILTPSLKTTQHYSQLQLYCQRNGKALSHNDIWIAALAEETGDVLVTFDKDFAALTELFDDKLIVCDY